MSTFAPKQPPPDGAHGAHSVSSYLVTIEVDSEGIVQGFSGPGCAILGLTTAAVGAPMREIVAMWAPASVQSFQAVEPRNSVALPTQSAQLEVYPTPSRGGSVVLIHRAPPRRVKRTEARLTDLGRWTRASIHMLNNSLVGILGYADWGLKGADEATRTRALVQILRGGKQLRDRTRILLEHGRALTLPSEPPTCQAEVVVEDALRLISTSGLDLTAVTRHSAEDTSAIGAPRSSVVQILANLIENALDAVEGDASSVSVLTVQTDDWVDLVVTDTGPGMNDAILSRAFEPFVTTKAAIDDTLGGSGLGLTLALRMAEEINCQLNLTSVAGEGTTATLRCPVEDADQPVITSS